MKMILLKVVLLKYMEMKVEISIKVWAFKMDDGGRKYHLAFIADRVNNDMQHNILIRFTPQEWSDNITKIIVLNSREEYLAGINTK